MRDWASKRYWIVGASEGLGRALCERLSAAGAELVLSARNEERLETLAARLPAPARAVRVDVSDSRDVARAAGAAGEIDGLVYAAGVYWPQAARDWTPEEVTAMCDINFTGAARVLGEVVPGMVARGHGHVVLTGSLSGFRGLPGSIGYSASKAGVMHLAECLRADLNGTGVEVQLVNPGFVRTRLTDKNDFRMPMIMEPEAAAREIFEHMCSGGFSKSFPRSFGALFQLSRFVPAPLYYRLFGRG
ncbi:SDR family NAD(P)-dependent oxidoreductase [Profundibacterium mesophilum]|uniref:Short-chain dehydrogenasereductase n=1 Tax=Profundibacterium mesophilum KAUST100406-0324 TaxID=1037889 RepID=A0A921TDU5_9RHOB|nr:SDR family NAD(P)-dependent oxidoreductase [Profundibacterium mesophilum]KAF0676587.1 Short-chain dehydrogenasereductase [Profundibacterium mesophilum KAUST100406-0324]